VADLVVVNKGDKPGAQRTAAQLRAMLVATAPKDGGGGSERPHPKRPEVLITTASTGEGVPELLAALDRHRTTGQGPGAGSPAPAPPARAPGPALRPGPPGRSPWSGRSSRTGSSPPCGTRPGGLPPRRSWARSP